MVRLIQCKKNVHAIAKDFPTLSDNINPDVSVKYTHKYHGDLMCHISPESVTKFLKKAIEREIIRSVLLSGNTQEINLFFGNY